MQRIAASSGKSWDGVVEKSADLTSLDNGIIQQFIGAVKKSGRRPIPEQISEQEFLRKMELVQDGHPTRATILLFGKNPGSFFPSAFLKMGRFRSPVYIVDDREVHGSYPSAPLRQSCIWRTIR
jgi:ATP-dependent DNA helicase RecG